MLNCIVHMISDVFKAEKLVLLKLHLAFPCCMVEGSGSACMVPAASC